MKLNSRENIVISEWEIEEEIAKCLKFYLLFINFFECQYKMVMFRQEGLVFWPHAIFLFWTVVMFSFNTLAKCE